MNKNHADLTACLAAGLCRCNKYSNSGQLSICQQILLYLLPVNSLSVFDTRQYHRRMQILRR